MRPSRDELLEEFTGLPADSAEYIQKWEERKARGSKQRRLKKWAWAADRGGDLIKE